MYIYLVLGISLSLQPQTLMPLRDLNKASYPLLELQHHRDPTGGRATRLHRDTMFNTWISVLGSNLISIDVY